MELWEDLVQRVKDLNCPWCLKGDFNVVLNAKRRLGANSDDREIELFQKFVNDVSLVNFIWMAVSSLGVITVRWWFSVD